MKFKIFSTAASAEEEAIHLGVQRDIANGNVSSKDERDFAAFTDAMFSIHKGMQQHYPLCNSQDVKTRVKFIDLLTKRVSNLDPKYVNMLMQTPTFINHKVVFERATQPRKIKGEDVPAYRTQLVLLLVAIAGRLLCRESYDEALADANRALKIGFFLNRIEQIGQEGKLWSS